MHPGTLSIRRRFDFNTREHEAIVSKIFGSASSFNLNGKEGVFGRVLNVDYNTFTNDRLPRRLKIGIMGQ